MGDTWRGVPSFRGGGGIGVSASAAAIAAADANLVRCQWPQATEGAVFEFARNTNIGGVIAEGSADQAVMAVNQVLHGPDHPSRLVLPVIRR